MNKWDKKAQNYSRYSEQKDKFEQKILKALKSLHVDFKNKTLLDVGCGTGVYTLHLAKKCLHVKGIDSSKEMIELLKKDAKIHNINNIETSVTSWDEFTCKDKFDFALTTMSPALKDDSDFQKIDNCAKIKIYLGWAGKRDSNILDLIFKAHGSTYVAANGSKKLQTWLDKNQKFYHVLPFEEKKVSTRSYEKSIENFAWHLEIRNLVPNKKIIAEVLKEFCDKDENITEITINNINLLVW